MSIRNSLILGFFLPFAAFTQVEVLSETPADYDSTRWMGPNRANFFAPQFEIAWAAGRSQAITPVQFGLSATTKFGIHYKRRFTKALALVADVGYRLAWYRIRQQGGKAFPDTAQFERERFMGHFLEGTGWLRLNFDPQRGDVLGKYFDVGISGLLPMSFQHRTRDTEQPSGNRLIVKRTRLNYLNPVWPALAVRLGFGHVALVAHWRFTAAFDPNRSRGVDLPEFWVGVQAFLY